MIVVGVVGLTLLVIIGIVIVIYKKRKKDRNGKCPDQIEMQQRKPELNNTSIDGRLLYVISKIYSNIVGKCNDVNVFVRKIPNLSNQN